MTKKPTLKRSLTIGLIQCIALLALMFGPEHLIPLNPSAWLSTSISHWFDFGHSNRWPITWILAAGSFYLLSDNSHHRNRLSLMALAYGGIIALLFSSQPITLSAAVLASTAGFALLCMLQQYHRQNQSKLDYPQLFHGVWNTVAAIALTLVFMLLAGLVLLLWAALFRSIGIVFFETLFSSLLFSCFAGPLLFTLGLYTVQNLGDVCHQCQQMLLSFCRLLTPLLALISVLYVVATIIHWNTPHQQHALLQAILPALALLGIIFVNACYQDGKSDVASIYKISVLTLTCSMSLLLARYLYNACFQLHILSWQSIADQINLISVIAVVTLTLLYHLCYFFCQPKQAARGNMLLVWLVIVFSFALGLLPKPITSAAPYTASSIQQVQTHSLASANLAWVDQQKLLSSEPVVLGYNQQGAIYACRATISGKARIGSLQNGRCTVVANQSAYDVKAFDILAGNGQIDWKPSIYSASNSGEFALQAQQSQPQTSPYLCRGISSNVIAIGSYSKGNGCWVINQRLTTKLQQFSILFAKPSETEPSL